MLFSNVSRAVATMAFMLAVSKVPAVNAEFLRRTEERQDTLFRRDDGSTLSAPYLTYQSEELESMYSYNLGTQFDPMPFGDALQLCTDLKRLCIGISLHVPQHHLWRIHFDHPSATLNDSPGSLTVVKNPANEEACPTTPYGFEFIPDKYTWNGRPVPKSMEDLASHCLNITKCTGFDTYTRFTESDPLNIEHRVHGMDKCGGTYKRTLFRDGDTFTYTAVHKIKALCYDGVATETVFTGSICPNDPAGNKIRWDSMKSNTTNPECPTCVCSWDRTSHDEDPSWKAKWMGTDVCGTPPSELSIPMHVPLFSGIPYNSSADTFS